MIRVLVVPAGFDPVRLVKVEPTLEPLKALLDGGWLEMIGGEGWSAYVDEEGKVKGLPVNWRANGIAARLGWQGAATDRLCGPMIVLGVPDDEGEDTGVTVDVLAQIAELGIGWDTEL